MNNNGKTHSQAAAAFLDNPERARWHDETLWMIRSKRDTAAQGLPGWEELRAQASAIKEHTLSQLSQYLRQFEERALANGIQVHWAADGDEHNRIVHGILEKRNATKVVKSKSMLTEECGLNPFLLAKGITVTDTDLGEYIVQLRGEAPSHIVLPAIHLKKADVSDTFHEHFGTEKGNRDEVFLTRTAREVLRRRFLEADAAITGVNFAIAETGGFVICTNEGNADLGVHAAPVHIACMGLEKIIPQAAHLSVFLRLLARSATGQPITTYSSHFHRPRPGQELHIVIVDNKRSDQLGRPEFRGSLKCIRCAACFNTCPVYRRSGGHSYHTAVAGPIGSILAPNLDPAQFGDLPFASTLCGSCTNVCPVKINIHEQLWHWRQRLMQQGKAPAAKKASMQVMAGVLARPWLYRLSGNLSRRMLRWAPFLLRHKWNPWYRDRALPDAPRQSFQQWYQKNRP
jgi:L-lactate dehydrogenase complex protein LldF